MKGKKKNKISKKKVVELKSPLKKSLGDLMKDEDGFVSKETILKVGLSTVAGLGVAGALTDFASGQTTHSNTVTAHNPADNCVTHTNVTTHSSY
jgi:hypothetical protein